jgi:hypothetical protein
MAQAEQPPSGTTYQQGGKPVTSLGVHEHWNSDATKQYSRNLDPKNGTGIELIYLPPETLPAPAKAADSAISKPVAPAILPGQGVAQHPFLYACDNNASHWPGTVQVLEVTPEKKIVWALSSWKNPDLGPATSIQLLDEPGRVEDFGQAR